MWWKNWFTFCDSKKGLVIIVRCDLCNGELEIVAGGKAICSLCGTSYSAERLQEKLGNISVQKTVDSKSNKEIESKLRLAESSVRSDSCKAIKLCEDVLVIEPENADAWTIKIEAEFSDVFSMHRGMESFRQACSLIEDDAARQSFIERNRSVILKTPLFKEDLIRPVLSADRDFAEKYLSMALKDCLGKTQESCRKQNADIESRLRRGMDLMETSYFAKGWNRTATYLEELFNLIVTVSAKNWNDESIYINMKKIVELEHATVKNVLKILDTRNDLKSLCNTAEFICNNINDKFAQRYWVTHADEKNSLMQRLLS